LTEETGKPPPEEKQLRYSGADAYRKMILPPDKQTEEEKQLPVEVFQAFERRDENQILAEMRGELLEELVYDIEIQGRRVTNLSYGGVKEAIRRRGRVEILEVRTEETDSEIRALVRIRDHENQIDVLGASTAEKNKPFAYTLALNKAERNGFAKLIPAKWYAVLIDEWLQRHGQKPTQPQPQPITPVQTTVPPQECEPLKVPITKDPLTQSDIKQYPLIGSNNRALGMMNIHVDGTQASIVPEKPINAEDPAIRSFLIARVLEAKKQKHPEFSYTLQTQNGQLIAILLHGNIDEQHARDLSNAARWAFERAMERESK